MKNVEDIQKLYQEGADASVKSFGQVSKGIQAIAMEMADCSKKNFEVASAAAEQLVGAKSLDKVFEVQSNYAKTAYESFLSQASKFSTLYADLAQEVSKPFGVLFAKASPPVK